MLRSLYIQNYALIEKLDIHFDTGFSVITGETGAGKSIILGAIGLLLGQRADVKAIRQGASKCIIEARFDVSSYGMKSFFEENELEFEDECILRREVQASGKSRAFINDTPASLTQMKELGEQLIDVHSQHQNLLLNKEGFQLNVLDILAHNDDALSTYHRLYTDWKHLDKELDELITLAGQSKEDEDYIRFQLEQLEEAHLVEGEQEELEQESETLSHAEEIKAGLYRIEQNFTSALIFPQSDISSIQSTFQPGTEQIFSPLSCQILLQAYRRNGLLDRLFIQRLHQIIFHFQLYRLLGILKFIEAGHDIITGIRRYFLPQFYGFQSGRPRHLNIYICHGDLMFFQHF